MKSPGDIPHVLKVAPEEAIKILSECRINGISIREKVNYEINADIGIPAGIELPEKLQVSAEKWIFEIPTKLEAIYINPEYIGYFNRIQTPRWFAPTASYEHIQDQLDVCISYLTERAAYIKAFGEYKGTMLIEMVWAKSIYDIENQVRDLGGVDIDDNPFTFLIKPPFPIDSIEVKENFLLYPKTKIVKERAGFNNNDDSCLSAIDLLEAIKSGLKAYIIKNIGTDITQAIPEYEVKRPDYPITNQLDYYSYIAKSLLAVEYIPSKLTEAIVLDSLQKQPIPSIEFHKIIPIIESQHQFSKELIQLLTGEGYFFTSYISALNCDLEKALAEGREVSDKIESNPQNIRFSLQSMPIIDPKFPTNFKSDRAKPIHEHDFRLIIMKIRTLIDNARQLTGQRDNSFFVQTEKGLASLIDEIQLNENDFVIKETKEKLIKIGDNLYGELWRLEILDLHTQNPVDISTEAIEASDKIKVIPSKQNFPIDRNGKYLFPLGDSQIKNLVIEIYDNEQMKFILTGTNKVDEGPFPKFPIPPGLYTFLKKMAEDGQAAATRQNKLSWEKALKYTLKMRKSNKQRLFTANGSEGADKTHYIPIFICRLGKNKVGKNVKKK